MISGISETSPKDKIKRLVDKFERLTPAQKRDYNESMTCKDFILPLFEALGWDVYNNLIHEEVTSETQISGKRVDYAFRLNGVIRFFLEAKKIDEDLDKEKWAEQTLSYAWHKGVSWSVLSDFESVKLFNAEWDEINPERSLVFEVKYSEYLTSEKLQLLTRESTESGRLDEWAKKEFKGPKKEPVDKQLARDLIGWREILFKNLRSWNSEKSLSMRQLGESVQTLLDRLIFIRTTEDRGIEERHLQELLRSYEEDKKTDLWTGLKGLFEEYNDHYDSKLFEPHICDDLEYENGFLSQVMSELYKKKGIRYNFADISTDVLGSIYEQYLGKVQQEEEGGKGKRKKQGIYYTPRYIVDFIVKSTLGEVAEGKPAHEIAKIKVLDSACGSGSFLIRAFEVLEEALGRQNWDEYGRRLSVLKECIYGVDLDKEAVEIAQLNLLLKVVARRERLPDLNSNLECGNSLVSGTEEELKEKFGDDWRERRPFNWKERFKQVFDGGGFDVIIGNPPYIKEGIGRSAFDGLHDDPYYQGKMDIWTLFACRAIDLLKEGGTLGFIAPNNWLTNAGASKFRNKILSEGEIIKFVDFGDYKVFEDAGIQTMIFVFKKGKPRKSYKIDYVKITNKDLEESVVANALRSGFKLEDDGIVRFEASISPTELMEKTISFLDSDNDKLINKILSRSNFHIDNKDIGNGIDVMQDLVNEKHLSVLNGKAKKGAGIFVLSSAEIRGLNLAKAELQYLRPYYTSQQLGRYLASVDTDKMIIYADKEFRDNIERFPNLKEHLDRFKSVLTSDFAPYGLHRTRDPRFFTGNKIISFRKTVRPAFSFSEFPCYFSRTFLVIKLKNINLKYLTGILNSRVAYFWFKNKGKLQGDMLQIDKEPLINFPICLTSDKKQEKRIEELVDKVMSLNLEAHKLDKILDREEVAILKGKALEVEKEIDQEVYKIYGLPASDVEKIEESLR